MKCSTILANFKAWAIYARKARKFPAVNYGKLKNGFMIHLF